ncbi:MAG: hypothetical protein Q9170_005038 [Blastenia crenularia]
MSARANALKEEGNKHFQNGDYKSAEVLYGRAIQQDSLNPKLFTNRAMTRIRLQSWDSCIDDCLHSIELSPRNMKAYYYLAQAQLALHHPNEALSSALTAYDECLKSDVFSSSTRHISQLVLQAKKEKWEAKERERIRRRSDLLSELEDGLSAMKKFELQNLGVKHQDRADSNEAMEEREDLETNARKKMEELRSVFALADPENLQQRRPTIIRMIHLAFFFHILIELPASIAFLANPSMTLSQPQPHAHAVIRQYALLLMSSNIIAYTFLFRPADGVSGAVAAALALYHVGPLVRAGYRIRSGYGGRVHEKGLGGLGPRVHLIAHLIGLIALAREAVQAYGELLDRSA